MLRSEAPLRMQQPFKHGLPSHFVYDESQAFFGKEQHTRNATAEAEAKKHELFLRGPSELPSREQAFRNDECALEATQLSFRKLSCNAGFAWYGPNCPVYHTSFSSSLCIWLRMA